ncbi:MAG: protein tyrosine phosphatase, partial [Mesorhizobium sp.]
NPLTHELVAWADIIFVMEKAHRAKLQKKFRSSLKKARLICLDIPDDYEFMDPELVQLLEAKVSRYL